jgi:phage gp36-like protein
VAYSTITDLKNYLPESVLLQLTDDNNTDDIDSEKIDNCIKRADDLIDGYVNGRYTVPIPAPVPGLIEDLSTKLAVYFLFKRSLIQTMPETITDDYKFCMEQLKAIQRGTLNPFPVNTNPTWMSSNKVNPGTNNGERPLTMSTMTSPGSARPYDRYLI